MSLPTVEPSTELTGDAPPHAPAVSVAPAVGPAPERKSRLRAGNAGEVGSAEFLFLAIFLNLMAFFAVLVAVSDFDEIKTRAALGSLHDVFGIDYRRGDDLALQPQTESGVLLATARARLERHLSGLAALTLQADSQPGDRLRFALAPEALFQEPFARIRDDRTVLLSRLVDLLRADTAGSALVVELATPLDLTVAAGDRQVQERADALLATIDRLGAPMSAVAFRVRPGASLSWHFRLAVADRQPS